jgi:hypothetical protein
MSEDGKKPLWPWIAALLIGLPVLYVASFGPACWLIATEDHVAGPSDVMVVYWPLGRAAWSWNGPWTGRVAIWLQWWMRLGTPAGRIAMVPTDPSVTGAFGVGKAMKRP